MPTLYSIVQSVRNIADNSVEKISKIYITGTGSMINNVDLYFQEYFPECKCEILKPYFIPETVKINMKDYIEVNSAIALGMQGLGYGIKTLNFKKPSITDKLPDWMKIEIGGKKEEGKKGKKINLGQMNFSFDLKGEFDNIEKWLMRTLSGVLAFVIIYSGFALFLKGQTDKKLKEVADVTGHTIEQIKLVEKDIEAVNNRTTKYEEVLRNLEEYKNETSENRKIKDSIPNFLTALMTMPQGVTVTSITNTTGYTIRIEAQSKEYSQLGYLIANLKTKNILYNVTSSSGVKQNDIIKVVIEGSLFPE